MTKSKLRKRVIYLFRVAPHLLGHWVNDFWIKETAKGILHYGFERFSFESIYYPNKFSKNKYSQNGEDGIIEIILSRLNLHNSDECLCVEFGAWDGKLFSNTFNLVEKGWNAIYIEGDEQRFKELLKTCLKFPKITPINTYISKDKFSDNSIDNILKKYSVPKDFDILSIDIDSFDLDVWESMENYNQKIVIIIPKVVIIVLQMKMN